MPDLVGIRYVADGLPHCNWAPKPRPDLLRHAVAQHAPPSADDAVSMHRRPVVMIGDNVTDMAAAQAVRQLRHHFGPFRTRFSALYQPLRAVVTHIFLVSNACRMLIVAGDPML